MSIFYLFTIYECLLFKSLSHPMSTFCYVLFHYPHYSINLSFCQEKFTVQFSPENNSFQNKISHIILTMSHIPPFSTRQIKIKFYSLKCVFYKNVSVPLLYYIWYTNKNVSVNVFFKIYPNKNVSVTFF